MKRFKIETFSKTITTVAPLETPSRPTSDLLILADPGNAGTIYFGWSDQQVFPLVPGSAVSVGDIMFYDIPTYINTGDIYVRADNSGDKVEVTIQQYVEG